ncbi:hypothetical protein LOK49_LG14G00445 [Camellia lanceoleosa]|uniref:Uncharacterized protein n=1 Tax=Camellia lanceoleosa TaxID=1840588 RepID=A0ACC0FDB2_9ERIC|nr:hypothetical protein LOK49_LG14G00445 [Camellia lanceoleosa]
MADSKVYTPIGGRSGSGGRGGRGGRGQNPVALNPELRERERGLQRRWEEKGEKGIGSAVDAGTATMPSGPSATDVSSPAFSSTYAFRSFCNRCKQPRLLVDTKTPADSKWLPRIGDWICTEKRIRYACTKENTRWTNGGNVTDSWRNSIAQNQFESSLPLEGVNYCSLASKMNNENYTWFPYEIGHPNDEAPVSKEAGLISFQFWMRGFCGIHLMMTTLYSQNIFCKAADVSDVDCILNCDSESISISANNLEAYLHLPIVNSKLDRFSLLRNFLSVLNFAKINLRKGKKLLVCCNNGALHHYCFDGCEAWHGRAQGSF